MPGEPQNSNSTSTCRLCGDDVEQFFDFGRQPVSNGFIRPEDAGGESFFRLAVGICTGCSMVQLLEEVPRTSMFHEGYPYRSSESSTMIKHFTGAATTLLETELTGHDDLIVEIGSNDGILLDTISRAGVRHLGVDPSLGAVEASLAKGVRAQVDFFDESTATGILDREGPAKVIFSANTFSHIAYLDSVMAGVGRLLAADGVFVFEDRYLGDIVENSSFDQIYDEHFYLFGLHSVATMLDRHGFQLVDAERLDVHGGAMRYSAARRDTRRPTAGLAHLLEEERARGLTELPTLAAFGVKIERICEDLVALLIDLRDAGATVAGYGATSKSTTVANYCGIDASLVSYVSDTTQEKQGRLTPGSHIPIVPRTQFSQPYPDYAVLFAWNHADEILAKEKEFRDRGGRFILYVPHVHVI